MSKMNYLPQQKAMYDRYMPDSLSVRIGGIAVDLAHIASSANKDRNRPIAESVIEESKWFIEWTAAAAEIDVAAQLVEWQLLLARWSHRFDDIWNNPAQCQEMIAQSSEWSQRVFEMSGLLNDK